MRKQTKKERREKRKRRIAMRLRGSLQKPRIAVFRSNLHIYAQAIDDRTHRTILHVSDFEIASGEKGKTEVAKAVGLLLAKKALIKKISRAVFDRGGYRYHGRIKAFAEGAREGGLVL